MRNAPTMSQKRKCRIAYLVTHPIQYQAPLLRLIAAQEDIEIKVFFQSDLSLHAYEDAGFRQTLKWDVPLLEGYEYEFLPGVWRHGPITAQRPLNWGFGSRLKGSQFDVLWVHGYARCVNWMAMAWARARGLKIFVRDEATEFSAQRTTARRVVKRALFKALDAGVDAFLAIGTANRRYYLAQAIESDRIFHVPYCVDNDFFATRAFAAAASREQLRCELALEKGRPVILYASKFEPRKRPQDLLNAYAFLIDQGRVASPPHLLFVGDGQLRASVEAEARARGLTGITFLGFRNQTELPALYDLCDVFVLPSEREPWGLVVNEVMAVGRAVVASDGVGCVEDLVKDGHNGFVYPAGNAAALADALAGVLAVPGRAQAMGAHSRQIISNWSFREDLEGLRAALTMVLA